MKKIIYYFFKTVYVLTFIVYYFIPISTIFFDFIDISGEYRKLVSFATIPIFIVLYFFSVELPSIVFKIPVERYNMFSKKYKIRFLSLSLHPVFIIFLIESIVFVIYNGNFTVHSVILLLVEVFFLISLKMSTIELQKIKRKFFD